MGTPIKKGINTIQWGSGNVLGTPTAAIVESLSITPKNAKPIEIEDNDGFGVCLIVLQDGFDADATLLHDTAKVYPADGNTVVLVLPNINGTNATANYNCVSTGYPGFTVGRKKEASMKFHLTYRPGVAVS